MEPTFAIRCDGLRKHYTHFDLREVDLHVEQGTVMGLVGRNGAGKSTILRIIMGLIAPDDGAVEVLGHAMPDGQAAAKYRIGFIAEDMRLYESETIGFHMEFVKSIFETWDDAYANSLLGRFDLIADQKVKGLSHGQRVKAILLLALARRPDLLIFDEPTTGLDPAVRKEVLDEMMSALEDETRTILFSSHNTLDIEQVSDYITLVDGGQVIESKDKEAFLDGWRRLRLVNKQNRELPDLENIRDVQGQGSLWAVTVADYDDSIPSVFTTAGLSVERVEPLTLEEIFLSNVHHAKQFETQKVAS